MTADILQGKQFAVRLGDNLTVMRSMPAGVFDVALTSPPYVDCRLYGELSFKLTGQSWVDWMVPRVVEACRVTAGLVFVNMAGKVKDFKYGPVVEWLVADLTRRRGIVCGPAPYVFRRVGIPGSGSKHYHRRDWEPVYAFALPANLPPRWSANTAMGHPPKWAPGGEMSNRLADGSRVNAFRSQSAAMGRPGKTRKANGEMEDRPKPRSGRLSTGGTNGTFKGSVNYRNEPESYGPPTLANPGNVIHETYTAAEVSALLADPGDVTDHIVGGGVMGSKLAHRNEAPFPLTLAEWFIRSYCPPGGIALDPFGGSGTVIQAALKHGRRALAIEIREEMVELCYARAEEALKMKGADHART